MNQPIMLNDVTAAQNSKALCLDRAVETKNLNLAAAVIKIMQDTIEKFIADAQLSGRWLPQETPNSQKQATYSPQLEQIMVNVLKESVDGLLTNLQTKGMLPKGVPDSQKVEDYYQQLKQTNEYLINRGLL